MAYSLLSKEVQQFLGFANFYRLFALTSAKTKFQWTPQADAAFRRLNVNFTSSEGNSAILTVLDRFLRWLILVLCPSCPPPRRQLRQYCTMFFISMVSPGMLCGTGGRSSSPNAGRPSSPPLGATVSLSSGHHPQSSGQNEKLNQDLETGLCCLASQNPTSLSKHLLWVESTHNTLPSAATGFSPFQCASSVTWK